MTLASILKTSACVLALAVAMPPLAQVPQYGSNVTLEQARKALTRRGRGTQEFLAGGDRDRRHRRPARR